MAESFPGVQIERDGHIVEITLVRPDVLNRIDSEVHDGLIETFQHVAMMDDVRAVVLASTGKVFSAGGDFDFMLQMNADPGAPRLLVRDALRMIASVMEIPAPVVVAMQGDSIGLGTSIALSCDAVVAHPKVRLSDPHVNIGLVAGDGGCLTWPQSVGMLRAKRHLLTGDPLKAGDAFAMGLVTDLVDGPDEVLPAARALAAKIAGLPPLAVQGTKAALQRQLRIRFDEVMELAATLEGGTIVSADLREAVAAFREKRTPDYKGV